MKKENKSKKNSSQKRGETKKSKKKGALEDCWFKSLSPLKE